MNYCILSCSGRPGSQSYRIALMLEGELRSIGAAEVTIAMLSDLLPAGWEPEDPATGSPSLRAISDACSSADALVFVVPEWGGMAPPVLKHLLQHLTRGQIAHKPGMLVGLSSGAGGAYPIAELRAFGFKNSHMVLMPHHVVLRNVEEVPTTRRGTELGKRLHHALQELTIYAAALASVRPALLDLRATYPNGM